MALDFSSAVSPITAQGGDPDDEVVRRARPNYDPRTMVPSAANPEGSVPAGGGAPMVAPKTAPAAVSPSGGAPNWQQMMRQKLADLQSHSDAASKAFNEIPATDAASGDIQNQLSKVSTPINPYDASGHVLQQYRPSIGQRIMRGVQAVGRGGVLGALTANYGAPNAAYQREEAGREMRQKGLTDQLTQSRAAFKEATDRAKARATDLREQSRLDADAVKGIQEQEERETNEQRAIEQQKKDDAAAATKTSEDAEKARHNKAEESNWETERKQNATRLGIEGKNADTAAERLAMEKENGGKAGVKATFKDSQAIDKYSDQWYKQRRDQARKDKDVELRLLGGENADADAKAAKFKEIEDQYKSDAADFEKQKQGWYSAVKGGKPVSIDENHNVVNQPAAQPQKAGKTLDPRDPADIAIAKQYLQRAGGDKAKARQLAKQDGYGF